MRLKVIFIIASVLGILAPSARAQQAATDTIYNPPVLFNGMPRTYELAGIKVEGAPNYEDFVIVGFSGLRVGDRIQVPGSDITAAAKRLMRQGLFAQARIKVEKVYGDKVWLIYDLRTQPRISEVRYPGIKKSEREDLQERLQLMKGNQITPNIVNRAEQIISNYYANKGFGNASVKIDLVEDLSNPNQVFVDINVNKNDKLKVHKIYIDGNEVLSDTKLKSTMKKTNEKGNWRKLFRSKVYKETEYHDDLNRILQKYNELGYRDAKILSDSVVPYNDKMVDVYINLEEGKKYYIKDIDWVGNTLYPSDILADVLDMKPGDVYNQKRLNKRL
ncbi:MAG: outer membrane protein assembly factor BamA, partial [Muribaculaceae bacterium]|nr:outer membrane protein assembly factor BamA [Muribaculaceae bacterium]